VAALGCTGPETVAVNAAYLAEQVVAHVGGRATLSVEPDGPLGTSGGVANLKGWIGGRGVLVGNADAYLADPHRAPGADIATLLDGWDGTRVRVLGVPAGAVPGEFGRYRFAGFSLLPWTVVATLTTEPSDLVRTVWRPAEAAGRLEVVEFSGAYLDTGTVGDYLAANLHAAATADPSGSLVDRAATVTGRLDRAVVGAGAVVRGAVTRGVVWPGGHVDTDEHLTDAVRVGTGLTAARR
jgi:NDP-sugar pyrophosphorylase family protein